MPSDLSIDGVFVPGLLVAALLALVLSALVSRLLARLGLYRLFAYPSLVGLSLFAILTALLVRLAPLLENLQ